MTLFSRHSTGDPIREERYRPLSLRDKRLIPVYALVTVCDMHAYVVLSAYVKQRIYKAQRETTRRSFIFYRKKYRNHA